MVGGNRTNRLWEVAQMRRLSLLLAAASILAIAAAVPLLVPRSAAAVDDCRRVNSTGSSPYTCTYTQMEVDWPNTTGPFCSQVGACVNWWMPNGGPGNVDADFSGISNSNGINWYNDLISAMHGWSGQQYNSPWMYQCSGSNCQYAQVHDKWADLGSSTGPGPCASTQVNYDTQQFTITSVTITYNNNANVWWWNGPPGRGHQYNCDAIDVAYHEEGHMEALGHSSDASDIMYWKGGTTETVTHDAQTGLGAIYGAYSGTNGSSSGSGGSSGGSGCGSCQGLSGLPVPWSFFTCGPAASACDVFNGYLAKAWDMSRGVATPNPVSEITPAQCVPVENEYTGWLSCMALYYKPY